MALKVYRITKMTGRYCDALIKEANYFAHFFGQHGITTVLDPVLMEDLPNEHVLLSNVPIEKLRKFWDRDKQCLREAHVAINCDAGLKSVGGEHEQGLMRFGYWKPLILVYPNVEAVPFISLYEDDFVTTSVSKACLVANQFWGTYPRRLKWRLNMLVRSVPKFIWRQVRFLFQ